MGLIYMGHDVRKTVIGVCDHIRLKPAETTLNIGNLFEASLASRVNIKGADQIFSQRTPHGDLV